MKCNHCGETIKGNATLVFNVSYCDACYDKKPWRQKERYDGRFKPYRKPKNPPPPPEVDQELAAFTQIAATELQSVALSMDTYPDKGALSVRDSNGTIWEITIQRSDAKWLVGENQLKTAGKRK